ncbi:MAG: TIGR01212 family radical SAM protein [Thermodesulfobacteriota bacterium]
MKNTSAGRGSRRPDPPEEPRLNRLAGHLRRRFGRTLRKVPLDAGFSCPNRDGTLSRAGCAFCNARGSGTGLFARGLSLAQQWERLRGPDPKRPGLAYLQAFSNTYGPAERLARVLDEIAALPGLAGLCLGARPDCLDRAKLELLAGFRERLRSPELPEPELWLELGLQSAHDATLARINRGHDAACFADAARAAAGLGIPVCAHLVLGLPGEGLPHFLQTVDFVNGLPVAGVKLHNLYVAEATALAALWRAGGLLPPTREDYLDWLCALLPRLRPDLVIHRLVADPAPGELLAPDWAGDKRTTLDMLEKMLEERDIRQGGGTDARA